MADPTNTGSNNESKTAEVTSQQQKAQEQLNKEVERGIELNDQLYERLVNSIAKSKEEYEIKKAIFDQTGESLEKLKAQLVLQDSYLNSLGLTVEGEEKLLKLLEAAKGNAEQTEAIEKELTQLSNQRVEQLRQIKDLGKEYGLDLKTQGEEAQKLLDTINDQEKTTEERISALKKIKEFSEADKATTEKSLKLQDKINGMTSKVTDKLGISAKFSDTTAGNFVSMVGEAKRLGGGNGMGLVTNMFKQSFGQSLDLKNVLGSVLDFAAKSALEISNLSRALGAATGYGDVFNDQIASIAQSATMSGVGFKEASDAIGAMANNLSSFDPKAASTNKTVGTTVARLAKMGVSAQTSSKNIDHLQRSMGLSTEAAADMSAQIALMGRQAGMTTSQMMSNFDTLKTKIAEYGNNGMRVFKEMNALMKATGLEMSTLTAAADKFNTFEGAADSVGKMNAVLGTQLSTLEMLSATDSERIMMIKQQVQMSVGNFDSLDRYTKMYIAQAMGVESVDKAQKLLNMSTAEYNKYTANQQESADIQKELADATAELVPMMEQLKLAGIKIFMVFKPIITVFTGIINLISWIINGITSFIPAIDGGGKVLEYIVGVLALAAIAFKVFGASMLAALGPIGWIIGGLTLLFGAFHLKGSPELWELPSHSAKGYENMANSMSVASEAANATSDAMKGVHDSMHKAGGKSFSIEAMAKLDTDKIAAGLTKVKSAMTELSTLKIDGFLAMSTDGAKSSIIMGSQGVIKSLSEGRLSIDVNMPEISLPPINVVVKVDGKGLEGLVNAHVEKRGVQD